MTNELYTGVMVQGKKAKINYKVKKIVEKPKEEWVRVEGTHDDGYSGANFNRPGITELLDKVRNRHVHCVIVKDLSRFSRDYIEIGSYLEQIFPFARVRFIAVNDGYDSEHYKGDVAGMDTSFKNQW